MMFIYPYNAGSASVKALRENMEEARIIRREGSKFRGNAKKVVINWGCTQLSEEAMKCEVINNPEAVKIAANKELFFDTVHEHARVPDFTKDKIVAEAWLRNGDKVVVREILNGHSGDGIVILETVAEFEEYDHNLAKIYVKYVPKQDEYRIHISGGEVIDQQRKAMRRELNRAQVNWQIRNAKFGFVFVREGVNPPADVVEQAHLAMKACGLDFGAVDVIWNNHRQQAFVLEINTAPGLEGTSVENYSNSMKKLFQAAEAGGRQWRNFWVDEAQPIGRAQLVNPLFADPKPVEVIEDLYDDEEF